jgi:hypothetical protein
MTLDTKCRIRSVTIKATGQKITIIPSVQNKVRIVKLGDWGEVVLRDLDGEHVNRWYAVWMLEQAKIKLLRGVS